MDKTIHYDTIKEMYSSYMRLKPVKKEKELQYTPIKKNSSSTGK